jgi:DNA-binding transcriptional LysR family regulator
MNRRTAVNLRHLDHLIALAETGSFSRAAEQLNLTQPALSRSIRALEEELGVPLFDRIGKCNELTPVGQDVLARARRIAFEAAELRRATALVNDDGPGDIRVGLGSGPGALLMVPFLTLMAQQRPRARVSISSGSIAVQLQALRARELDALVIDTRSVVPAEDLCIQHMADVRGGFLCRKNHPLLAGRRVHFEQLLNYPIASSPMSQEVRRMLVAHYGPRADPDLCTTLSSEHVASLIDLTARSDTIFLGIVAAAREQLAEGSIVELVLSPRLQASARFGFITLSGRTEVPSMALFRSFAAERLHD